MTETPASNAAASTRLWKAVRPLVLKVIIGSVVAAALIGVAAMVVGEFGTLHLRAILTVIIIVVFSLLAWYDADVSSKRSHNFALVGVFVSLYLLIAGILKVWVPAIIYAQPTDNFYAGASYEYGTYNIVEDFWHWIWLVIIARFALLHAHLLLNIHRKYVTPILQLTAKITIGLIVLFAILLTLPTLLTQFDYTETYWRFTGAVFILDVLGTVLIPLSYALFGPKSQSQMQPVYSPTTTKLQAGAVPPANVPSSAWGAPSVPPVVQTAPVEPAGDNSPTGSVMFEAPPVASRKLAWPRYEDGTPLPVLPDGTPDFSAVERY